MAILLIIAKIWLVLCAVSTVFMVGEYRKPLTKAGAVWGLVVLGTFYYLISN